MQSVKRAFLALILSLTFLLTNHGFSNALEVGQPAPDFELDSTKGGKLKLSSLKGKNVLINFYVLDFSPT
jgi:cytochrome oxidase Cu insertion factor (SCO1/SenC/PrrC family)